jgi:hypothetical protein
MASRANFLWRVNIPTAVTVAAQTTEQVKSVVEIGDVVHSTKEGFDLLDNSLALESANVLHRILLLAIFLAEQ